MPPTLATSWMLLMLCVGAGGVLAACLACRDGTAQPEHDGEHAEEHPPGLQVGHGRVPRVLVVLYIGMALGMIGYVLYVWLAAPGI